MAAKKAAQSAIVVWPGVDLVISPDVHVTPSTPATAIIRLINHTGDSMLRVYNEGGCNREPGCRFYNNQNHPWGILQLDSPTNHAMRYTMEYRPDWRWCTGPSCPVVPLWLCRIYWDE